MALLPLLSFSGAEPLGAPTGFGGGCWGKGVPEGTGEVKEWSPPALRQDQAFPHWEGRSGLPALTCPFSRGELSQGSGAHPHSLVCLRGRSHPPAGHTQPGGRAPWACGACAHSPSHTTESSAGVWGPRSRAPGPAPSAQAGSLGAQVWNWVLPGWLPRSKAGCEVYSFPACPRHGHTNPTSAPTQGLQCMPGAGASVASRSDLKLTAPAFCSSLNRKQPSSSCPVTHASPTSPTLHRSVTLFYIQRTTCTLWSGQP